MKPIKQTILHDPDNGNYGNCAQAAFASLFELPLEDVPHFGNGLDDSDEDGIIYNERVREWLKELGYGILYLTMTPGYVDDWKKLVTLACDHHLISGMTERGFFHAVVGKGGEVVHDPHPSDAGLLPPTDDDPWYFEFIVKRL